MSSRPKITLSNLRTRKREGGKFAMITCYDHSTATIVEESGIESALVGDTYAEVCLGHPTTLPMKLDHLLTITEAVRRGAPSVFLVGDMPFLTYQVSEEEAVRNAGRFLSEAGCDCVKFEVDERHLDTVARVSAAGIPVMAHLGLRPQSIHQLGGYRIQGKSAEDGQSLVDLAVEMEAAGATSLLLEAVTSDVAQVITRRTSLPVVGIMSGPHCDAQVVVLHDMLGFGGGHPPRRMRRYAELHGIISQAMRAYDKDVRTGAFPDASESVGMDARERERFDATVSRGTTQSNKSSP